MAIILPLFVTFSILWILVTVFDRGLDDKLKRIFILTLVLTAVSTIGRFLGLFGLLIAAFVNVFALMKFLGYDFLIAFMFSLGLELVQYILIYQVIMKFLQ